MTITFNRHRNLMMKRTLLAAVVVTGLLVAGLAPAQQVDFNGTWQLDVRQSRITTGDGLEGLGDHAPAKLYINQQRNGRLVMSSRLPGSTAREYILGGQTWVPAPRPAEQKIIMRSRTRQLSMISEATVEIDGEIVSIREVMTMHPRGDSIVLEVTTTRPWGPETNTLVYNRIGGTGG